MIEVTGVPAFSDNYIWLIHGRDRRVAVVDPGDADPVIARLEADGLEPAAILITHHHYDHVGGIGDLLRRWPVPVYGPAGERIAGLTHPVGEGDQVEPEGLGVALRTLDVPGHTRGHVAYYGDGALFCGDTLFTCGCGRLFEGTPEQMYDSLVKLAALPDDTQVYCAHEYTLDNLAFAQVVEPDSPALRERLADTRARRERDLPTVPATLALEKATNPFLRCRLPHVIAAAEHFAGARLDTPARVFATVRHWKDTLD